MSVESGRRAGIASIDVDGVGAGREAARAPAPDVVRTVGLGHRPAAARRLEPELEGRVGAAGRGGGELYCRPSRLRRGRGGRFGNRRACRRRGRKSVVWGRRVDVGGRRLIKKEGGGEGGGGGD